MSTNIDDESIELFCKMVMNPIKVNSDTRAVLISIIEILRGNNVPQESWRTIFIPCVT